MGNLIWNLLEIYCSLQQWKTFANRSRIDKVIAMYRVAPFFDSHCSSGRQPNFAALNRGRHLYSAGRPSRWALAHILVVWCYAVFCHIHDVSCIVCSYLWLSVVRSNLSAWFPSNCMSFPADNVHGMLHNKLTRWRVHVMAWVVIEINGVEIYDLWSSALGSNHQGLSTGSSVCLADAIPTLRRERWS